MSRAARDRVEAIRPYLERALHDESFRKDLREALQAARDLYGPIAEEGATAAPRRKRLADLRIQDHLRRALEDLVGDADATPGRRRRLHGGQKMLLVAGLVAGVLYNPWTGAKTRERLLDLLAGHDDLQPRETAD